MKKFISMLVIGMFLLMGCSATPKPETTVSGFIEAAKDFDLVKMTEFINPENSTSKEDIQNLTKENDDNSMEKYFIDYFKENAAKITYKIVKSEIEGDDATVSIELKHIDGGLLFKATVGEVFQQLIPLAFSGTKLSDEETEQMYINAMKKQQEIIKESFKDTVVDMKLTMIDKKWYINELNDDFLNVLMSGFISAGKEIGESMGGTSTDNSENKSTTVLEKAQKDNMTIIQKQVGEEIAFATLNLKVNSVDEAQTLAPKYGSPVSAKEGAKFIIVNLDLMNTTNTSFSFSPGVVVTDNKDREFKPYSDTILSIDNYIDYRDLSPSIKENGNLVFELPNDATSYSLLVAKGNTNELYQILLK